MRKVISFLLVFAGLLLTQSLGAQSVPPDGCGDTRTLSCSGPGCFGTYTGQGSGDGTLYVTYFATKCCNKNVVIANGDYACNGALLKNDDSERSLITLAEAGVDLLIRGCDGHFSRYTSRNHRTVDGFNSFYAIQLTGIGL